MKTKKRVCFFGRVSTNMRQQDLSLENSKEQIVEFIQNQENEIFDLNEDLFEERVSGVKLVKGTKKEKGFDELIEECGIKIIDNNKKLSFEIVKDSKYQKIYCKSTSRIGRMQSEKKISLLSTLKKNNVEVYFYNLHRTTFDMTDVEMLMFAFVDNNFSKNMSFNSRNNRIYKMKTKQVMMNKRKFGWNIEIKDNRRKYVINEKEYKILHYVKDLILKEDLGFLAIERRLKSEGITSDLIQLSKYTLNRIFKDKHYIGQEKYYDFEHSNYINEHFADKSYLKTLNFEWSECDDITRIFTDEEWKQIQDKIESRTTSTHKGQRHPFTKISKKCICANCGYNYYSLGSSNRYNEQAFKCSSKRTTTDRECNSNSFYINFFNEWLEEERKNLFNRKHNYCIDTYMQLLYLKNHLVLLLDSEEYEKFDDLCEKIEEDTKRFKSRMKEVLLYSDDFGKEIIEEIKKEFEDEINELIIKRDILTNLRTEILNSCSEIDLIIDEVEKIQESNKSKYSIDETLDEFEKIYIHSLDKKSKKNRVYFVSKLKIEVSVFELFKRIEKSDIMKLLKPRTLQKVKVQNEEVYKVRELTEEEQIRARELRASLGLD